MSLLTREQEIELVKVIHGPDPVLALGARDELVLHNLGLVGLIAKWYRQHWHGSDFDDLFSEGVLALLRAATRFKLSRGVRFSTYANKAIHHSLLHYLKTSSLIYVPIWAQSPRRIESLSHIRKKPLKLQVMARLAKQALNEYISLSQLPDERDSEIILIDNSIAPIDTLIDKETIERVRTAIAYLTPTKAFILAHRHQNDHESLQSIGSQLGYSTERIRQLESEAIGELRTMLKAGS